MTTWKSTCTQSRVLPICFCLEGLSGIEPELTESKSVVLPLYDSPTQVDNLSEPKSPTFKTES